MHTRHRADDDQAHPHHRRGSTNRDSGHAHAGRAARSAAPGVGPRDPQRRARLGGPVPAIASASGSKGRSGRNSSVARPTPSSADQLVVRARPRGHRSRQTPSEAVPRLSGTRQSPKPPCTPSKITPASREEGAGQFSGSFRARARHTRGGPATFRRNWSGVMWVSSMRLGGSGLSTRGCGGSSALGVRGVGIVFLQQPQPGLCDHYKAIATGR